MVNPKSHVVELLPDRSVTASKFAAVGALVGALFSPRAAAVLGGSLGYVGARIGSRREATDAGRLDLSRKELTERGSDLTEQTRERVQTFRGDDTTDAE